MMFTIKKRPRDKDTHFLELYAGPAKPLRPRVSFLESFHPEEVTMSVEGNGQLGTHGPVKVIEVNTKIPEDFEPAMAVVLVINKVGRIVMDADWDQLPLVLHMMTGGMNTTLSAVQLKLQAKPESPIIAPGDFRV